jgi:hypothetical protein
VVQGGKKEGLSFGSLYQYSNALQGQSFRTPKRCAGLCAQQRGASGFWLHRSRVPTTKDALPVASY